MYPVTCFMHDVTVSGQEGVREIGRKRQLSTGSHVRREHGLIRYPTRTSRESQDATQILPQTRAQTVCEKE